MAIQFPPIVEGDASPINGDAYLYTVTGEQFIYDSVNNAWTANGLFSGAFSYLGTVAIQGTAPASPSIGDIYSVSDGGLADVSFTGLAGSVIEQWSLIVFDGFNWNLINLPSFRNFVSLVDFGAQGDFSSDSTPALISALEYAQAAGGAAIYVPAGVYKVASQVDLDTIGVLENVVIYGEGPSSIFKLADNYNGADDRWIYDSTVGVDPGNVHNNFVIRNIAFDGNEANMGSAEVLRDKVLKFKCNNFTLRDCHFYDECGRGIFTVCGDGVFALNNRFTNIGGRTSPTDTWAGDSSAIHPGNAAFPASRVVISGNVSTSVAHKDNQLSFIDTIIADGGVIEGNINNGDNQALLLTTRDGDMRNVVISNNNFDVRTRGIYVYFNPEKYPNSHPTNPGDIITRPAGSISNIQISNNIVSAGTHIFVDGEQEPAWDEVDQNSYPKAWNIKISGNTLVPPSQVYANGGLGIRLRYAYDSDISENTSNEAPDLVSPVEYLVNPNNPGGTAYTPDYSYDVSYSSNITIIGNISRNAYLHGLELEAVDNAVVADNVILDSSQGTNNTNSSIKVTDPCTYISITNNRLGASSPSVTNKPAYGVACTNLATTTDISVVNNTILYTGTEAINIDSIENVVNFKAEQNIGFNDISKEVPLNATTNSWNGGRKASTWLVTAASAGLEVRGINAMGPSDGQTIRMINVGSNSILFYNQAGVANPERRIITGTGANITLPVDGVFDFYYDGVAERWRIVSAYP